MEVLKHFSHEHPLILVEVKNNEDREFFCYGCKKAIAESGTAIAYSCGECSDNIFLHKACAQLPGEINYPMHSQHSLILQAKPVYQSGSCKCNVCCKYSWSGFTYHCAACEFDICVLCAFLGQIIEHPSHPHSLVFHQREASFSCDACGKEDKDLSYSCTRCQFWIHKSCALLPEINKHGNHNHPLSLAYSLPIEHFGNQLLCNVCGQKVHLSYWVYYCGPCKYFVHLKCIAKEINQLEPIITSVQPSFEEIFRQASSLDGWIPSVNELLLDPFSSPPRNQHGTQPEVTQPKKRLYLVDLNLLDWEFEEARPNKGLDLGNLSLLPSPNSGIALPGDESESSNSVGNDAMFQSTQANGVSLALRLGRGLGPRVVELPNESASSYSVKNYSIIPRSFTLDNIPRHVAESDSDHMDIDAFVQILRRG